MYPIDRRKLAVHMYSILGSLRKTAKLLMVSHSTIFRWLASPERKQYNRTKNHSLKSEQIIDVVKTTISFNPFTSIKKLQNIIHETLNLQISIELVRTVLKRLGLSKKVARYYGDIICLFEFVLGVPEFTGTSIPNMTHTQTWKSI